MVIIYLTKIGITKLKKLSTHERMSSTMRVITFITLRKMSMDAVRVIVNNLFKENFYGEKKNILTIFLFSIKNSVKIFLK